MKCANRGVSAKIIATKALRHGLHLYVQVPGKFYKANCNSPTNLCLIPILASEPLAAELEVHQMQRCSVFDSHVTMMSICPYIHTEFPIPPPYYRMAGNFGEH